MEKSHVSISHDHRGPPEKLENILLATDRSVFSEGAVREAIRFANKYSSRLFVMSVLETNPEYETIGAAVYEREEVEALRYLETIIARASQEGLRYCKAALHYGEEPYRLIVDEAAGKKTDMIILGRRGRNGFMKVLMGRVAARVVRHAPCKVLVVPKAARIECRNVLVATNGSGQSAAAAQAAIGIAKRWGSELTVVSAVRAEDERKEAEASVRSVVAMAKNESIRVEALTPPGRPHEVIVETAGGRGVDLIVMGSSGTKGINRLFFGSPTKKVIGLASCAVLVVGARNRVD